VIGHRRSRLVPGLLRRAVCAVAVGVLGLSAEAAPRPAQLLLPDLALPMAPIPLGVARPPLELPPAPPVAAPAIDLGSIPLPPFLTAVPKPLPAVRDPGSFKCVFTAFRGAEGLADCGVHRLLDQDVRGAAAAFEESLAVDPQGTQAARAHAWLGEIGLLQRDWEAAERHYRAALGPGLPPELAYHVELGLALVALQKGDPAEADRALGRALTAMPPQAVAVVIRYLQGVARLLMGKPAEAMPLWDQAAQPGASPRLVEELPFWRGVALGWLGDAEGAERSLEGFARAQPNHPLRLDALAQEGYILLERGRPADAERLFREAEGLGPRAELRPQIRLGLVRVYLVLGDTTRAAAAARRLAAETPQDPLAGPALVAIADAAEKRGARAEALDLYRQILRVSLAPAAQEYVSYRLAEALERDGARAEAKGRYRALRDRGREEGLAERAAYRLGSIALAEGDVGAALREGEGLLRAGTIPELREAVLLLTGEAAARGNDPNRAAAVFRLALRDFPSSPRTSRTRLALGWAILKDGDAASAVREWRSLLPTADLETRGLAAVAIADVAIGAGRDAEAFEALRLVGTPDTASPVADTIAIDRGLLALRAQQYAEAIQTLEPVASRVAEFPRQALVRRALGLARYRLGEYDLAERQFRQAAALAPAEPSSWLGAGLAALAQSRYAEAEDALQRARIAIPEVAALAQYGLVVSAWSRPDAAAFRERGTAFVDRYPTSPFVSPLLYALATSAGDRGQVDEAQAWVRRLLRLEPPSEYAGDALERLTVVAKNRPDVLRDAYRDLLARGSGRELRGDAWLGLADTAFAAGDFREAQRAAEGFLQDGSDDSRAPRAQALLVRAYQAQGLRPRALEAAEAFLRRFPSDPMVPTVELARGQLLVDERRWDLAQQAFETARERGDAGVAAPAQFWLGETLRQRGDYEGAIVAYLGATYLYPGTPWAARGLQGAAQAYVSRRMPREAGIVLRKLVATPDAEPALVAWARTALAQLGPQTGQDPSELLKRGSTRP
jgi:tetratricopeptide (TPR) repeat protein